MYALGPINLLFIRSQVFSRKEEQLRSWVDDRVKPARTDTDPKLGFK